MAPTTMREYRIAPDYRRSVLYVAASAPLVVVIAYWFDQQINQGPERVYVASVIAILVALCVLVAFRWRVRIDEHGIARRICFRWTVWPWADIASGRIRKLSGHTLLDPSRPRGRRTLRLEFMERKDIQEVMRAINAHYRLPPSPEVPDSLTIKYGFRKSATFDRDGISLRAGGMLCEYEWGQVEHLRIWRIDPIRRDFTRLTLSLPHHEIELKIVATEYGHTPSWRGATSEVVNEFLLGSVSPDRAEVCMEGERLTNFATIENELAAAEKQRRGMLAGAVFLAMATVGVSIWFALDAGIVGFALCLLIVALPSLPLIYQFRQTNKRIAELSNQLMDT